MAEREAGGFGGTLRQARERRGISLRKIADDTKISIGALEALERNEIARLPGGIFSRAIVRAYAEEVGLDPEQTTQDFVAQFPHDSVTAGHPATTYAVNADENTVIEGQRRSVSAFLWMALISVPVAGALIYFSITGRPGEPASASRVEPQASPASGSAAAPVLSLGVTAAAPTQVRIVADGMQVLDRQFQAGDHQSFEVRREVLLAVSDSSALTLTLNGRDARMPGAPGQSAVLTLTPSNYTEYLTAR